jgi:hypothetical protein
MVGDVVLMMAFSGRGVFSIPQFDRPGKTFPPPGLDGRTDGSRIIVFRYGRPAGGSFVSGRDTRHG